MQINLVPLALKNQRGADERSKDLAGGPQETNGFIEFTGTGEGVATLDFPITFIERPLFTFGWETPHTTPLIGGQFPTCNIGVYRWNIGYNHQNGGRYWQGASLIVVITGPDSQAADLRVDAHVSFAGRALRPAG